MSYFCLYGIECRDDVLIDVIKNNRMLGYRFKKLLSGPDIGCFELDTENIIKQVLHDDLVDRVNSLFRVDFDCVFTEDYGVKHIYIGRHVNNIDKNLTLAEFEDYVKKLLNAYGFNSSWDVDWHIGQHEKSIKIVDKKEDVEEENQ